MTINNKQKIFISYSHKDEELMQRVINHLQVFNLNFETWIDKNIDPGDEWEEKIKNAIHEADMAILLVSNDFLISDFIKNKELPWLGRKQELDKLRIVPFILKPSNWNEFVFYEKLEVRPKEKSFVEFDEDNGDREKALKEFAKKVKELLEENVSNSIPKSKLVIENNSGFYNSFSATFAIYRVLALYNESEEYYFKLASNLSIYKKGTEYPIEIWRFNDGVNKIENYSNIMRDLFNKDYPNTSIGVVQNDRLSGVFSELSNFFSTLVKLQDMNKDTIENMIKTFYNSTDIATFVSAFFEGKIRNLSFLDSNAEIEITGSIFLFTNFHLLGFMPNELRQKIFKLIVEKYKIQLTEDGSDLFAIEAFLNAFEDALSYMKVNKSNFIDFQSLISKIDILKLPLPNENNLDFIQNNIDLVEKNISSTVDINIKNIYVESKAKFYYKNDDSKYENVENISSWLEREIENKNFLILLGDFGHGKTTLFKYMTAKLSKEYNHNKPIPVYISLREHFAKGSSLKDAVTNAVMPRHKMTDDFWKQNNWLIFCDSFDELGIYHQDEPNWITLVFTTLLNESKKENIKILLSSRPVLFLDPSVKKETVNNFDRLILKPFDEVQITQWLENWSKYNQEITFEMIKERNLLEVSQTPVILFLIATIFHEELNEGSIKYSKSQIYKKFFDWTAKSGGFVTDKEEQKHNVPDNYREILQEIACEIFTHPNATSGMLHYEVLLKQLSKKFEDLDLEESLNKKIFVAHAFKESVPEHIEFIHQSLREYLVAEKIFNNYLNFVREYVNGSPIFQFNYINVIFTRAISENKLHFFRDMIEMLDDNKKREMKNLDFFNLDMCYIVEQLVFKGMTPFLSYQKADDGVFQELQESVMDSVIGNITLLHFLFKMYIKSEVDFDELNRLINFYKSDDKFVVFLQLLQKSLIGIDCYEKEIYSVSFDNFMLNNCTYYGVNFENCNFKNTSFKNSVFCESGSPIYLGDEIARESNILTPTEFKSCTFENVVLFNVEFRTVAFSDCFFYKYKGYDEFRQFEDVEYNDCQFFDSVFQYEFFKGVIFNNCIFFNAQFVDTQNEEQHHVEFNNCIMKDTKGNWIEVDNNIWSSHE